MSPHFFLIGKGLSQLIEFEFEILLKNLQCRAVKDLFLDLYHTHSIFGTLPSPYFSLILQTVWNHHSPHCILPGNLLPKQSTLLLLLTSADHIIFPVSFEQ